jgi:hypothetical protein
MSSEEKVFLQHLLSLEAFMHLSLSCQRGVTPGEPLEIPGNAKSTWNKV